MKTIQAIGLLAFSSLLFTACKKETTQSPDTILSGNAQAKPGEHVQQKFYPLSTEQTTQLIKQFKASGNHTHASAKTFTTVDSLAIDSSIFVIEATLNYDYDYIRAENYNYKTKVIALSIPAANGKVSKNNVNVLYDNFTLALDSVVNDTFKVEVADVEGFFDSATGSVSYRATVSLFNVYVKNPCAAITVPGSPWRTKYLSWGCSNTPAADGPTLVNQRLNCVGGSSCNTDYYYSNITTAHWDPSNSSGNPYPNALVKTGLLVTPTPICASGIISAAQLNTYKNGCVTLATSVTPTPANAILINKLVSPHQLLCVCTPPASMIYWNLDATYGVLHCGNRNNK